MLKRRLLQRHWKFVVPEAEWVKLDYYALKANEFVNIGNQNPNNLYIDATEDGDTERIYGWIRIKYTSDTTSSDINGKTIITNNDKTFSIVGTKLLVDSTQYSNDTKSTQPSTFMMSQNTLVSGTLDNNAIWWHTSDYGTGKSANKYRYNANSQPHDFINKTTIVGSINGNSVNVKLTEIAYRSFIDGNVGTLILLYPYYNPNNNCVYFCTDDMTVIKPVITYYEWCESLGDMYFRTDPFNITTEKYQLMASFYYPEATNNSTPVQFSHLTTQMMKDSSDTKLTVVRKVSSSTEWVHTGAINNWGSLGTNILLNIRNVSTATGGVYYKWVERLTAPQNNFPFSTFNDVKNTTSEYSQISGTSRTAGSYDNRVYLTDNLAPAGTRFYGLKLWTGSNAASSTTLTNLEYVLFPAKKENLYGVYNPLTDTLYENKDSSGTFLGPLKFSDGSFSYPANYHQNTSQVTEGNGTVVTTTIVYDNNGHPVSETIIREDTNGNVSTQQIGYDENGDPQVTGYLIDTSTNTGGGMDSENNGIDTGFVPFDGLAKSWEMNIKAYFKQTEQPTYPGTSVNYNTAPCTLVNLMLEDQPWPGIVLRYQWDVSSENRLRLISDGNGAHHTVITQPSDNIINLRVTYSNKTITITNKWTDTIIESYAYDFDNFNMGNTTVRVFASFDPSTNQEFRRGVGTIYEFSILQI